MKFEEKQIMDFLKPMPGVYFSITEIGKKAGSRQQFQENPSWPRPHLVSLAQQGEVRSNALGQYCYEAAHDKKKRRYKIGGHLQQISAQEAALHVSPHSGPKSPSAANSGNAPKAPAA